MTGLYPPPNHTQVTKFKKKWYKRNIDPDFDDAFEPPVPERHPTPAARAPLAAPGCGENGKDSAMGNPSSSTSGAALPRMALADGCRWAVMGRKAGICFSAYAVSLSLAVASVAGVFPPWQALLVLVGSFVLELLAKYGLKFKSEYLHAVLLDDVGVMPMMALTLLTPGLHPFVRIMALGSPFLTALMSFAQICRAHTRLTISVREFFAPLAETHARHQVMQVRADVEVFLGFALVVAVFTIRAAPISALLFWNFMMMRYMMSEYTQVAFKKLDVTLSPVLCRIPVIKLAYASVKRNMYGFVDPESRRAGRLCMIL